MRLEIFRASKKARPILVVTCDSRDEYFNTLRGLKGNDFYADETKLCFEFDCGDPRERYKDDPHDCSGYYCPECGEYID